MPMRGIRKDWLSFSEAMCEYMHALQEHTCPIPPTAGAYHSINAMFRHSNTQKQIIVRKGDMQIRRANQLVLRACRENGRRMIFLLPCDLRQENPTYAMALLHCISRPRPSGSLFGCMLNPFESQYLNLYVPLSHFLFWPTISRSSLQAFEVAREVNEG